MMRLYIYITLTLCSTFLSHSNAFPSPLTLQLASQMDEKFKKQFPTRKELEIVSSTREWKKRDNAAKVIAKFFLKYVK